MNRGRASCFPKGPSGHFPKQGVPFLFHLRIESPERDPLFKRAPLFSEAIYSRNLGFALLCSSFRAQLCIT